jgi:hypothetical protein
VSCADLPATLGRDDSDAEAVVDTLRHKRLVMRFDDAYVAVGAGP